MVGVVIISIVLLVLVPVGFMLLGAVISAMASWTHTAYGEESHPGSELIDLNR